jgi:hypothetical protein
MYHLVFLFLLAGQPVDAATKTEPDFAACELERTSIVPALEAEMQAKISKDATVVGKCMDDDEFTVFLKKTGRADPDMKKVNGEERVD